MIVALTVHGVRRLERFGHVLKGLRAAFVEAREWQRAAHQRYPFIDL